MNDLWTAQGQPFGGKAMGPISKVRVTEDLIHFESEGFLNTDGQQVPLAYVYDVDVSQSFMQKSRNLGNMKIHVRRPESGEEVVTLNDMPTFREGASIINEAAKHARARERQATQTHYYAGGGMPPTGQPHQAPHSGQAHSQQSTAPNDDMAALKRLKSMHEEGLITEDEYTAKKAEIISRL